MSAPPVATFRVPLGLPGLQPGGWCSGLLCWAALLQPCLAQRLAASATDGWVVRRQGCWGSLLQAPVFEPSCNSMAPRPADSADDPIPLYTHLLPSLPQVPSALSSQVSSATSSPHASRPPSVFGRPQRLVGGVEAAEEGGSDGRWV